MNTLHLVHWNQQECETHAVRSHRVPLEAMPIFFVEGDQPQTELVQEQTPEEQCMTSQALMSELANIKEQAWS